MCSTGRAAAVREPVLAAVTIPTTWPLESSSGPPTCVGCSGQSRLSPCTPTVPLVNRRQARRVQSNGRQVRRPVRGGLHPPGEQLHQLHQPATLCERQGSHPLGVIGDEDSDVLRLVAANDAGGQGKGVGLAGV